MTELSGMELRRALCEELGWELREHDNGFFYICLNRIRVPDTGHWNGADSDWVEHLPRLESSPGVFWPEFEKWCEKTIGAIGVAKFRPKPCRSDFTVYACAIRNGLVDLEQSIEATAVGDTVTEAGCRAWLKAIQALKEK